MASYPTTTKSFTTKTDGPSSTIQAAHVNDLQDEIVAIENGLRAGLAHDVKANAGSYFFANGRSVAEGQWITPAFSAGTFTGAGAMTWTVEAADVQTFAYTLIGKTMIVAFYLGNTSVGGTPSLYLQIAIPGGFVAAKNALTLFLHNEAAVGNTVGYMQVGAGASVITLHKINGAEWLASANITHVFGTISFEVQ